MARNRAAFTPPCTNEELGPSIGYGPQDLLGAPSLPTLDSKLSLRPGNTFLNNVTYLKGHHLVSEEGQRWIESQVGESINFDRLFSLELQWLRPFCSYIEPWRIHTAPPELPSRAKVERYIRIYGSSSQSLAFPVISQSMFGKTLDLAYSPLYPPGSASAKACVYAFLSFVSLFGFDDVVIGAMDIQSYALAAQNFVTPVIEEMTVDGLQSLIMLVRMILQYLYLTFLI